MQPLDHPAVELDHALAGVFGQREGADDGARALDLGSARREGFIAELDLRGVDQRLAVEAEVAALLAFEPKTVEIADVIVDAVDDVGAMRARCGDAGRDPGA